MGWVVQNNHQPSRLVVHNTQAETLAPTFDADSHTDVTLYTLLRSAMLLREPEEGGCHRKKQRARARVCVCDCLPSSTPRSR